MRTLKRILGICLLGIAFLFVFRIPTNLHSGDPKAHGKIGADVVFAFVLGGSAFVLLSGSRKAE
jgi:hypothetical protein